MNNELVYKCTDCGEWHREDYDAAACCNEAERVWACMNCGETYDYEESALSCCGDYVPSYLCECEETWDTEEEAEECPDCGSPRMKKTAEAKDQIIGGLHGL